MAKRDGVLKKHRQAVMFMVNGGMESLIDRAGGECAGYSVRLGYGDCLMVIRADFNGKPMVCFVGATSAAAALARAEKELRNGKLRWRKDDYRAQLDSA